MFLEALEKHNRCEVVVGGTSMWPFIRDGDTASIKKNEPFTPSPGTVVAFFAGEQLIVHRIIWCKKKADGRWDISVHGDASPGSQSKINADQVIGSVEYVKRQNRKITLTFNDAYRIIAIPLGLILQFIVALRLNIGGRRVKKQADMF